MRSIKLIVCFFCAMSVLQLRAQLKLPAPFSDHMVLQQQAEVSVWGWAAKGTSVTVEGSWDGHQVIATAGEDGRWETKIATPKAGGPYSLKISDKNDSVQINDVLIGEVWVASGQSNMVFSLAGSKNGKKAVANANYPKIRYMEVERQVSETPQNDAPGSKWEALTPDNAGDYSAVAIYYALHLQKELNVPIGIMEAAWGGTAADNWTPEPVLKNDPKLTIAFDRYDEWMKDYPRDSIGYYAELKAEENGIIFVKPEMPASIFIKERPHRRPSALYNGMIHPLIKYNIKGVIWYQGETNRKWNTEYAHLFSSMIKGWREAWNRPDLPFYFAQLPRFGGSHIEEVSKIMEAQLQVLHEVDHTGMAITIDVGDMHNIHPTEKKAVGDRLALWALAKTYNKKISTYSGPIFKNMEQGQNGDIKILFDHTGSGLMVKGSGNLQGFEAVPFHPTGTEKRPQPLKAKIDGNSVIVNTEGLARPFVLRYGWAEEMVNANLFNSEKLPASAFRVLVP